MSDAEVIEMLLILAAMYGAVLLLAGLAGSFIVWAICRRLTKSPPSTGTET